MIALVKSGGGWSIADIDFNDGNMVWWCGEDEWVNPSSLYWHMRPNLWETVFKSLAAAERFAKKKGWFDAPE